MARQTWRLLRRQNGKCDLVPIEKVDAWLAKHRPAKRTASISVKQVERGSWVCVLNDAGKAELIPKHLYQGRARKGDGLQVIKDIEPFQNVAVDWGYVGGRRQRRDMMRAHGLVEVGNERLPHRMEIKETRSQEADRVSDIKQAMRQNGVDIL